MVRILMSEFIINIYAHACQIIDTKFLIYRGIWMYNFISSRVKLEDVKEIKDQTTAELKCQWNLVCELTATSQNTCRSLNRKIILLFSRGLFKPFISLKKYIKYIFVRRIIVLRVGCILYFVLLFRIFFWFVLYHKLSHTLLENNT